LIRALGFQVTKKEVVRLAEEADIHQTGRVEFNDYMEISTYIYLSID
jgi:Ca2+-binding EF-hand superfamily protein